MGKKLTVQHFGGVKVGTVVQEHNGSLTVKGETPEIEQALRALIAQIAMGPLTYHTGRQMKTDQGVMHITVKKTVEQGDSDYLNALADTLPKYTLLGKRIRGIVEESANPELGNPPSRTCRSSSLWLDT